MKFLIAGDWQSKLHETPMLEALEELSQTVFSFKWFHYFDRKLSNKTPFSVFVKGQRKYMLGPIIKNINDDLVREVNKLRPDVVFIYRGSHIFPQTLKKIKEENPNLMIIGYNNDDPFSPAYPKWMWRHFNSCIPLYDLVLAYRSKNIDQFLVAGARKVRLMRSWFNPKMNYPVKLNKLDQSKYESDVVFIGHYENDGRKEYLQEVVRRGWRLRLFGPGYEWNSVISGCDLLSSQLPVQLVWGEDYNKAIAGSKIALCFFSKLNSDTYTRRCFEIPASKRVLLSEYSDDLANLFVPDKEVLLFKDLHDMGKKIEYCLSNPESLTSISKAGYERVWNSGHDVKSRMKELLSWVQEHRNNLKI